MIELLRRKEYTKVTIYSKFASLIIVTQGFIDTCSEQ